VVAGTVVVEVAGGTVVVGVDAVVVVVCGLVVVVGPGVGIDSPLGVSRKAVESSRSGEPAPGSATA
jgi:hypothetical protein